MVGYALRANPTLRFSACDTWLTRRGGIGSKANGPRDSGTPSQN
jgi:hypothetical protein